MFDYGATLVCGYPPEQENTATYDMLVKTMKADGYSVTFTAKYKTNEYTIIIVDTYSGTDEIVDVLTDYMKAYVTNYDVLVEAETEVQEIINTYKCPICAVFFENYGKISSSKATEVVFSVLHVIFHEACHALEYFASGILGIFSF